MYIGMYVLMYAMHPYMVVCPLIFPEKGLTPAPYTPSCILILKFIHDAVIFQANYIL